MEETSTSSTFHARVQSQTYQNPENNNGNATLHGTTASAKRKLHRDVTKSLKKKNKKSEKDVKDAKTDIECHDYEDDNEDDKAEVERKILALQSIVPGGDESVGVDNLFEKTAGYILSLQCQVKAIKALTSFFEGLENEKKMLGLGG